MVNLPKLADATANFGRCAAVERLCQSGTSRKGVKMPLALCPLRTFALSAAEHSLVVVLRSATVDRQRVVQARDRWWQ